MSQFGGSQKTVMLLRSDSLTGTTADDDTLTDAIQSCFAGPERKSSLEHGSAMRCGFGDGSETKVDKQELTVPCFATKADTSQVSLSDRLTPLLISAGLVCGTIPLSMRDAYGQQTLGSVLKSQVGGNAEKPKAD